MKKLVALLSVIITLGLSAISASADASVDGVPLSKGGYVDDNGSTMVQLRPLAQRLGCTVEWKAETSTACISQDVNYITAESGGKETKRLNKYMEVQIGNPNMYINYGESVVEMTSPVAEMNGSTYVPLRSICEVFGCDVVWDESTQSINVLTPEYKEGCKVYGDFVVKNNSEIDVDYDEDTMQITFYISKSSNPAITVEELRQILKAKMTEKESHQLADYINDSLWTDENTRYFSCKYGKGILYIKSNKYGININTI